MSPSSVPPPAQTRLNALSSYVHSLLFDRSKFPFLAALVILGDLCLTQLIIHFISYTEIDWKTYMAQVTMFLKGEQNYSRITGPTGPLVYPAGHVYVHQMLYDFTSQGTNIRSAQAVYAMLYIASLVFTCAVYLQAGVPNWIILLLPLSKRLHSIYVLRLFNDCWASVTMQAAIWALGRSRGEFLGIMLFAVALSIKMSVLLYLPGLLVILVKQYGIIATLGKMGTVVFLQLLISAPFMLEDAKAYWSGAFDFSRSFLYKWTINWRFMSEETFLDRRFAALLLVLHASVLLAFAAWKWTTPDGGPRAVIRRALQRPFAPAGMQPVTADQVATIMYTSNLIGILFARSLHYQFYSWYAQQLPLLAWRTRLPMPMKLVLLGAIEYAWNVYPSTKVSSGILLAAHAVLLAGIWLGYPNGLPPNHPDFIDSRGQSVRMKNRR